jgi:hypothetical protein
MERAETKESKLDEINEKIFNCNTCKVHDEICLKPDFPLPYRRKLSDYKIIAIGINPKLDLSTYQAHLKELYKQSDHYIYKSQILKKLHESPDLMEKGAYISKLTNIINEINNIIKVYQDDNTVTARQFSKRISSENYIYDYILWANLSWCPSQKPNSRYVKEHPKNNDYITCNVYSEEIPNCLDKGYLQEIIELVEPELILFLKDNINDIIYHNKPLIYESLIAKLLNTDVANIKSEKEEYPLYDRNGKTYKPLISSFKPKDSKVKVIALPHPSNPAGKKYKKERECSLAKVCNLFIPT